MKVVCIQIVRGKWGPVFSALPICWLLDEKHTLILNKLWTPDEVKSRGTENQFRTIRSSFAEFGCNKTRHIPRHPATAK
jgi:hypothetical protein